MLTEDQKNARSKGLGGSDAMVACGFPNFNKTPLTLYYEKIGEIESEDLSENERVLCGSFLEPSIVALYEKKTGNKVTQDNKLYHHKDYSFMLANIDGIAETPDGKKILLEVKNVAYDRAFEWAEEVPKKYRFQVAHYLSCLDLEEAHVFALIGGCKLALFTIKRDREQEEELIKRERDFWENHVLKRIPPKSCDIEDIKRFFKTDPSLPPAVADNETIQRIKALNELNEEIKRLTKLKDQKTAEIILSFGKDATMPEIMTDEEGNAVATYKTFSREYLDTAKIKAEDTATYNKYLKKSEYKMFRSLKVS